MSTTTYVLLMSTHNICFRREIRKLLCGYPLLPVAMRDLTLDRVNNYAYEV